MRPGVSKKKKLTEAEAIRELLCRTTTFEPNDRCADCGAICPNWVSLSYGVFICDACSGVHRSFGAHITRVKSITADTFTQQELSCILDIGNGKSNAKYLAAVNGKIPTLISAEDKAAHIKSKYLEKKFSKRNDQYQAGGAAHNQLQQNQCQQVQQQQQHRHQASQGFGQTNMYPKASFAGANTDQAITNSLYGNMGGAPSSTPLNPFFSPSGDSFSNSEMFPSPSTSQSGASNQSKFSSFSQPSQSSSFAPTQFQQPSSYSSAPYSSPSMGSDITFGAPATQPFSQHSQSSFGPPSQTSFSSTNFNQFSQPMGGSAFPSGMGGTQPGSFSTGGNPQNSSFADTSSFFGGSSAGLPSQSGSNQFSQFPSQPSQQPFGGNSAGMSQSFSQSFGGTTQTPSMNPSGFGVQTIPPQTQQQQHSAQFNWQGQNPGTSGTTGGFGFSNQSSSGPNPFM